MRSLVIGFQDFRAHRRLLNTDGVKIHPTAKVAYRKIRWDHSMCRLEIGEGSIVEATLVSEREGASIFIGRNSFIGGSLIASAGRIEVGDDVLISWDCKIVDHNSHATRWSERQYDVKDWYHGKKDWTHVGVKPVKIGSKSWLGLNVIVLKGVEIGEGAVVAAGSVVVKSVSPWTIVGGNPAKPIGEVPFEKG